MPLDHPLFEGLIASRTQIAPPNYIWQPPGQHGVEVVGRVLFPHLQEELRDHVALTAYGMVHVARILEPNPELRTETRFTEAALPHVTIENAIRTLHADHSVRVFNLSIGYRDAIDRVHVEELSEVLDDLAKELDVVIVVPTGNVPVNMNGQTPTGHHVEDYPHFLDHPLWRLTVPGDSAISLTVGSIAHSDAPEERERPRIGWRAVAPVDHVSPFSRTGPGVGTSAKRLNKPDLVEYGGNWVLDDMDSVHARESGVGVISTSLSGSGALFAACCGTSFAAPVVARIAADTLHAYPQASANLIRALVANSAHLPQPALAIEDAAQRFRLYGHGRPNRDRAIGSGPRRVSMTFDGSMAVDSVVIHPVLIPAEFAIGRSASRIIRVALAFDPPVRRQRREYLAANMQLDLYRAVDAETLIDVLSRQDPNDPEPLISGRRRVSNLAPGPGSWRSSTLIVREWQPRQLNVDDGEIYYVAISHRSQTWARDRSEYTEQKYALVVTLEDEARLDLDLYALVAQRLRQPVRVRLRSSS
ncbi:S8 family peptidase [Microbispora triticiradicis]|uniref:S8 family peptidase n=1 Tax=Microbispora triticiradicis TaxID=2200763 RepID=UPI003A8E7DE5